MPITASANGKTFTFPDGTPQDEIGGAIDEYFTANPQPTAPQAAQPQPKQLTPIGNNSRRVGALIRSIGQGPTFNAMDEIISGLQTLPTYAINKLQGKEGSIGDTYNQILATEQAKLAQDKIDYPAQDFAGQLGGGLLLAGPLKAAASMLPTAAKTVALANPLKAAALTGGLTSGLSGFAGAEGGLGNRLIEGAWAAPLGLALGTGGGLISNRLAKKAANKLNDGVKLPVPTAAGIRANASDLYKAAEKMGGKLKPGVTRDILNKIDNILSPQNEAEAALRGEHRILKGIETLRTTIKDGASFSNIKSLEKELGDMARSEIHPQSGAFTAVGERLNAAKHAVRDMISNVPASEVEGGKGAFTLKRQADKLWAQHYKLKKLESILTNAEYSEQPATALKNGLKSILTNPSKLKDYSPAEEAAIKSTAKLSKTAWALRSLGSRLISTFAAGSAAASGFGPAAVTGAATSYGVSAASRAAANKIQFAKAEKLARLLGGQSIAKPTRLPIDAGVYSGILANSLQNR